MVLEGRNDEWKNKVNEATDQLKEMFQNADIDFFTTATILTWKNFSTIESYSRKKRKLRNLTVCF